MPLMRIPRRPRRHHGRPARAGDRRALAHGLRGGARRDVHAEYLDTTRPGGVIAPSALPGLLRVAARGRASGPRPCPTSIAVRSVHATHDLRLHRRARAGRSPAHDRHRDLRRSRARPAPTSSPASRPSTPTAARSAPPTTAPSIAAWSATGRRSRRASPGSRTRRAMPGPFRNRTAQAMDRRHDATGPSRCPSRRVSPTPTRSARGSGIPSTPTERSPGPPGLPDIILHGTATLALAVSAALAARGSRSGRRHRADRLPLHGHGAPALRHHRGGMRRRGRPPARA